MFDGKIDLNRELDGQKIRNLDKRIQYEKARE